jgi:hypothetical protein
MPSPACPIGTNACKVVALATTLEPSQQDFTTSTPTSRQPPPHRKRLQTWTTRSRILIDTIDTDIKTKNPQTWLVAAKVRADSVSRYRRPPRLIPDIGKTGGKTGGKGDGHVKTPKSHSAKAGLQVSSCPIRVIARRHPAHLLSRTAQKSSALILHHYYSSPAVV